MNFAEKNNIKFNKKSNEFYIDDLNTTYNYSNDEKLNNFKLSTINYDYFDEIESSEQFLFLENKNIFQLNNNDDINKRKFSIDDYQKKFKTEMCKNYQLKGYCNFGNNCSFAHGDMELRDKINENDLYKTKRCLSFQKGYCPYGYRCQYIHSENNFISKLNDLKFRIFSILENKNNTENLIELLNKEDRDNFNNRLLTFKKITNY